MLTQHDGNVSNSWNVSPDASNDVFLAVQVALTSSIEFGIIGYVVVAFGQ